jgi:hypothetical protein
VTPPIEIPPLSLQRLNCVDRRGSNALAGSGTPACGGDTAAQTGALDIEVQIAAVLANSSRRIGSNDRVDLITLRCKRLARMYRELASAGARLADVKQIEERHAKLLLGRWRERKRSPATIRSDWSILRVWCEALGRPDCIKTLREYWPEAPRSGKEGAPTTAPRHRDAPLLAALRQDRDRTHYFVERLCQALRLSVQEALLFPVPEPYKAPRNSAFARKLHAAMTLSPVAVTELLAEAAAFLSEQDRPALIWPGLQLAQAMRRHENRLAYLRRMRAGTDQEL